MSFARSSYAVRSRWIASLALASSCTGVVGAPTASQPSQSVATDGGEAPSSTEPEVDEPEAPIVDGGVARDGGRSVRDAGVPSSRDAGASAATQRSAGCGKSARGSGAFERRTARIGQNERSYHVRVPANYDAKRAYPLVFRFHGSGGDGLSGGLDIERASGDDAIVVGADGVNRSWSGGEGDVQLFDTMLQTLSDAYCVDLTRVFAYGFSAGGGFTNLLGCLRADKLRGTASIAGFDRGTDPRCAEQPIAAWYQHDQTDPAVPIATGRAARDRVLRRNDCGTQTKSESGCTSYTGCDESEPVVWCETQTLGHDIDGSRAPAKVWDFFSSLP